MDMGSAILLMSSYGTGSGGGGACMDMEDQERNQVKLPEPISNVSLIS